MVFKMETNNSKKIIIIVAIIIAIIVAILLIINRKPALNYTIGKAKKGTEGILISSKKELDDLNKQININDNLETNNYKKTTLSEKYNDEFFKNNKLAVIAVYEDDSKEYIHSIDEVKYDSNKTSATINYTYKQDIYIGTLGNSWYTVMLVELKPEVSSVNFVNLAKK